MATVEECEQALTTLAERMQRADGSLRDKVAADGGERRIACRIKDLEVTFLADLRDGGLHDIRQATGEPGKVTATLTMTGNDLLALVDGELSFPSAWASGRVSINAGIRDMLQLRSFFF